MRLNGRYWIAYKNTYDARLAIRLRSAPTALQLHFETAVE